MMPVKKTAKRKSLLLLALVFALVGAYITTKILAATSCTTTLNPGADVSAAIKNSNPGSTICLTAGNYNGFRIDANSTSKSSYVTVKSATSAKAIFTSNLMFDNAKYIRLEGLQFNDGISFRPAGSNIQIVNNDITGSVGILLFGDNRSAAQSGSSSCPCSIHDVQISSNHIHDIDYSGAQNLGNGVGVGGFGDVYNVQVAGNTIEKVASDYIQSGMIHDWLVDGNTFLGPSLQFPNHPSDHQDLWQIFGCETGCYDLQHVIYNITFSNNIVRSTQTAESLLFQTAYFQNVQITNNLFDKDSRGTTVQLYNTSGLVYRNNTHIEEGESASANQGAIFRDGGGTPGNNYQVDHNIFIKLRGSGQAIGTEGGSGAWGTYDFNVSSDASAQGQNSIKNWVTSWVNTTFYEPIGLPYLAGYRQSQTTTSDAADINSDGSINIFDLSILLSHFNTLDVSSDLNADGTVNIFDLSILLSHFR